MIVSYLIWKRSVDRFIPVYIERNSKKVYKNHNNDKCYQNTLDK